MNKQRIDQVILKSLPPHLAESSIAENEPLTLDSMSIFILINNVEEEFGVSIDYRQVSLDVFYSYETIANYVSSLVVPS